MASRVLAIIIAAIASMAPISCAMANPSWSKTRSAVMDLREKGNLQGAYSKAASYRSSGAADAYDAQFVAGWIALRFMGRPDLAIGHFAKAAEHTQGLKGPRRRPSQAQAGYWLGRALTARGKASDAETMYRAAMAYPETFYGQLSAADLKVSLPTEAMQNVAGKYPVRNLYWHDQRARRELVLAVIKEESSFRQSAVSSAGARGLMQVMPGTARHIGKTAGVEVDLNLMNTNADYNIAVGSKYLADQLSKYRGNSMLALAAYNAGPQRVDEWLKRFGDPRNGTIDPVDWIESIPFTETRDYVKKVIGSYVTYIALAY